eukprot:6181070-Pleurochrysis_carterae.AAC.7
MAAESDRGGYVARPYRAYVPSQPCTCHRSAACSAAPWTCGALRAAQRRKSLRASGAGRRGET